MNLTALSDQELLEGLDTMIGTERRLVARVVAYLAEVEERRLDLRSSFPSLFEFCTRRLGFSLGEAFRRMTAARLVRRFPSILGRLERGEIHMSNLVLLRDFLTTENHEELLREVAGKTKGEVKELLARRFPRPDVPATLTPLPASISVATLPLADGPAPPVSAAPVATAPHRQLEPLAPERYKLEVTIDAATRAKLERAVDLMRHRNPSGDFGAVLDKALEALIDRLEKQKLGKAARATGTDTPATAPTSGRITGAARTDAPATAPTSGRIARATRRAVFERDGEQCTYVDHEGHRCPARTLLELDHVVPRALGGDDSPANLRVCCRAHNRLVAEEVFGREHVASSTCFRQRKLRFEQLGRGLRDLGFGSPESVRAIRTLESRFARDLPSLEQLVREALRMLT